MSIRSNEQSNETRRLTLKIAAITGGAFLFAFSLVPLYRIACEQVFGIRLDTRPVGEDGVAVLVVDESRTVTVHFDSTVHAELDWLFEPEQIEMTVHPGQVAEAWYVARNVTGDAIVGNAVPSVAPAIANGYFSKTECFCFTEQLLEPGEERRMPVRFFVAPDLPQNVRTVTLSYTFYNNEAATRREHARMAQQVVQATEPRG